VGTTPRKTSITKEASITTDINKEATARKTTAEAEAVVVIVEAEAVVTTKTKMAVDTAVTRK
jgi:hypothetical protein